jgi:hypothetical protein
MRKKGEAIELKIEKLLRFLKILLKKRSFHYIKK